MFMFMFMFHVMWGLFFFAPIIYRVCLMSMSMSISMCMCMSMIIACHSKMPLHDTRSHAMTRDHTH
jgi:hypothetical protein